MKSATTQVNLNTGLGLVAILLWSTVIPLSRSAVESLGTFTTAAIVYLVGGSISLFYIWVTGRLRESLARLSKRYLFICGALFVTYFVCLYMAIGGAADRHQVLEVGLINYLWPALALVFAIPILNMRGSLWLIPSVAIALIGIFLVLTAGTPFSWPTVKQNLASNTGPYILAFLAAVSWALYSNLSRKLAREQTGNVVAFFMLATGCVMFLVRMLTPESTQWSVRPIVEVCYTAIASMLGCVFWDNAMRRGDIVLVVTASYFTPLISTLMISLYLGVSTGSQVWLGCGFIMAGAWLCKRSVI